MKVGDLVTFLFQSKRWREGLSVDVGLIVETGQWTGNTNVKVLWAGMPEAVTQKSSYLRVINESR
tara:strand:- start:1605 stop:1799 length:195 start_codon:yes stop_codon:yes gene_type:complete